MGVLARVAADDAQLYVDKGQGVLQRFAKSVEEQVKKWAATRCFDDPAVFEFVLGDRAYRLHFTDEEIFQTRIDDGSMHKREVFLYSLVKPVSALPTLKEAGDTL